MKRTIAAILTITWLAAPARAQFSYPGCANLQTPDFRFTELFAKVGPNAVTGSAGIAEPVQMDLHGVRSGNAISHVNIYFVERLGKVKVYDGAAKQVLEVATIPVHGRGDNGLMGIALHPGFDSNRWMFLWYCPPTNTTGGRRRLQLVRYTVTSDQKLESKKVIIDILASNTDNWHSGGPMTFDKHGDLWLQIGNNSLDHNKTGTGSHLSRSDSTASSEWGSSNTASMRGGTIRIHPDNSEKGYSIPSGNFGEYWATEWAKRGNAALAAEYRNPAKVLPEIYIKGERSNFSINVHPTKRWMVWGTVSSGPNDKFSITANPLFSGWPYFQGNNARTDGHQEVLGFLMDPAAPRNTSPLKTGVVDLPPAVPGTINGLAGVAFSGPIYAFDPSLASDRKFPPHLNNAWFGWDWKYSPHPMWIFTLDSNDISKPPRRTRVDDGLFRGIPLRAPTQMKFGPDGSLYVLNYDGSYSTLNPGVVRVDYVGSCRLPVTSVDPNASAPGPGPLFAITLSPAGLRVDEPGAHEMELYDLAGTRILSRAGKEGTYYSFRDLRAGGLEKSVHVVRVKTARGLFVRKVAF